MRSPRLYFSLHLGTGSPRVVREIAPHLSFPDSLCFSLASQQKESSFPITCADMPCEDFGHPSLSHCPVPELRLWRFVMTHPRPHSQTLCSGALTKPHGVGKLFTEKKGLCYQQNQRRGTGPKTVNFPLPRGGSGLGVW